MVGLTAIALFGCTPVEDGRPAPAAGADSPEPEPAAEPWLHLWFQSPLNGYVTDALFRAPGDTWVAYSSQVCQLEAATEVDGEVLAAPWCVGVMGESWLTSVTMDLLVGERDDELLVTAFDNVGVLHDDNTWTSPYEGWSWELGDIPNYYPYAGRPGDLHALARDQDGRVYVASSDYNMIWRFDEDGVARVVAGVGFEGYSGDGGPAVEARLALRHWGLSYRGRLAIHGDWLYIADSQNFVVRRVNLDTGMIERFAGLPGEWATDDTPDGAVAVESPLDIPIAITVEPNGDVLIVERACIRRVHADGTMSKVLGWCGRNKDNPCDMALLEGPAEDLCLDGVFAAEYDLEGRLNLVMTLGVWVLLDGPPEEQ